MTISAVSGITTAVQTLPYQRNYIEYVYNQNCGSYEIAIEPTDPSCDFTSLFTVAASTGSGGVNNLPYP